MPSIMTEHVMQLDPKPKLEYKICERVRQCRVECRRSYSTIRDRYVSTFCFETESCIATASVTIPVLVTAL